MPNPNLQTHTFSDEIELRGGEIHDFYADFSCEYTTDGNSWHLGSYKIYVREKININGETIEIKLDYTDRVPDLVVEKIFEEYIVQTS